MVRSQRILSQFLGAQVITLIALMAVSLLYSLKVSWPAAAMTSRTELSELPLTFPVQSPEIATYFNQIARPEDIAAFPTPFVHLLPDVTAGQKMVIFRSWAEAESKLDELLSQISWVGYNPEHWEHTPDAEQQNLLATVQQAAEFVHARGLRFMLIPDRRFTEAHLSQLMPHVDIIVLQGQRLQKDPQLFAAWVGDMIRIAHGSNPAAQVYVQVGATQGAAPEMLAAIQTVANDIDGIAVWSMPRSFDTLQEFVSPIRPVSLGIEAPAASAAAPAPATTLPTKNGVTASTSVEAIAETTPSMALPTGQAQPPQAGQDSQAWIWLIGIALLGWGIVIGLLFGLGLARGRQNR